MQEAHKSAEKKHKIRDHKMKDSLYLYTSSSRDYFSVFVYIVALNLKRNSCNVSLSCIQTSHMKTLHVASSLGRYCRMQDNTSKCRYSCEFCCHSTEVSPSPLPLLQHSSLGTEARQWRVAATAHSKTYCDFITSSEKRYSRQITSLYNSMQ